MIVTGTFPIWFYYAVGPLIGGVAAALAYRLVGMADTPKAATSARAAPPCNPSKRM